MTMTSRQRVIAAIEHRQPDRIPVDLGATPSSGISAIAYAQLKKHLGLNTGHVDVYDVVQQLAQPETSILDRYRIDVVDVGRVFNDRDADWYETTLPDGSAARLPTWFRPQRREDGHWIASNRAGQPIAAMPIGATFYDQTIFPWVDGYPSGMAGLDDAMAQVHWAALVHSPWDHAHEAGFWDDLRRRALALRASTDRAIMVVCGCNLFEWGTFLRRMDNFFMDIAEPDAPVEAFLDALMERHLATLEKVCRAVGDVVDILRFGDDLGADSGPFMSPATYRRLFKPRHAQLCAYVHSHSQMKTFLHSCGSIYRLLPDLIAAGYDIINPVQTVCRDMEPERLKREFGKDICFWGGGSDTRAVLNRGTVQEVRDDVRRRLDILAPGGGFVFNPIHNILPDVPPANIEAMFAAIAEYGK